MANIDKNPNSLLYYLRYSVIYLIFISLTWFLMTPPIDSLYASQTILFIFSKCVRLTLHFFNCIYSWILRRPGFCPLDLPYWIDRSLTLLSLGSWNCEGGIWLFFPHTGMIIIKTLSWMFQEKYECIPKKVVKRVLHTLSLIFLHLLPASLKLSCFSLHSIQSIQTNFRQKF